MPLAAAKQVLEIKKSAGFGMKRFGTDKYGGARGKWFQTLAKQRYIGRSFEFRLMFVDDRLVVIELREFSPGAELECQSRFVQNIDAISNLYGPPTKEPVAKSGLYVGHYFTPAVYAFADGRAIVVGRDLKIPDGEVKACVDTIRFFEKAAPGFGDTGGKATEKKEKKRPKRTRKIP